MRSPLSASPSPYLRAKMLYYQAEQTDNMKFCRPARIKGWRHLTGKEMTENKVVIKINYDKPRAGQTESRPRIVTEWHIGRIIAAITLILIILALLVYFLTGTDEVGERSKSFAAAKNTERIIQSEQEKSGSVEKNNEINANLKIVKKDIRDITVNNGKSIEKISANKVDKADITGQTDSVVKVEVSKKTDALPQKPASVAKPAERTVSSGHPPAALVKDARVTRTMLVKGINNKEPFGEWNLPIKAEKDSAKGVFFFTEIKNMKGRVLYHRWYRDGKLIFKRKINILGKRWRVATSKTIPYSGKGRWEARLTDGSGNILSAITFDVI